MEQTSASTTNIPRLVQVYRSIGDIKMQGPQVYQVELGSTLPQLSHTSFSSQEKLTYHQVEPVSLVAEIADSKVQTSYVMHMGLELPSTQSHPSMVSIQSISVRSHTEVTQHVSQNQMVMLNEQPNPIQPGLEPQQPSHMILPSVSKQHMILNGVQQYFGQFEYQKDCLQAKIEPEVQIDEVNQIDKGINKNVSLLPEFVKTKKRSKIPNPNKWVCNLRKLKHQRGEAYISRRGQYVPEKKIQNIKDCSSCMHKCSKRITQTDREHIFKAFWSLSSNEKKHFLLNTTDRDEVYQRRSKSGEMINDKKKYTFKYFFLVRGVRYTVCKQFYLGTLAISQKPVYNVHLGKSEVNVPKPDGRGLSGASSHALPSEMIDRVRNHISTFKTTDSKPVKMHSSKKQFLNSKLSVKQMYALYTNECRVDNCMPVKEHMYRKIFKQDFNLHFKRDQKVCCKCQGSIKKE